MAIVNRIIATMPDDVSGLVANLSVDYDDSTLRITALRANNPTSRAILLTARRISNGRIYNVTFPAGQADSFISIPGSPPADRLAITIDERGRLDGVEYSISWIL